MDRETVLDVMEEGGLPPVCATVADEDCLNLMLGDLLARAVKVWQVFMS